MLTDREKEHIKRVAEDIPRYESLSLLDRLTDRGDVMKAVPMVVIDTMQQVANILQNLIQIKSSTNELPTNSKGTSN